METPHTARRTVSHLSRRELLHAGLAAGVTFAMRPLYRTFAADSSWNAGHVNDPKITAMLKEQRRLKDLEVCKQLIFDIQRYAGEQHYYVHLLVPMVTQSGAPYVRNYGPNITFD
jgi:ABC-type transport system substrate-binding protein